MTITIREALQLPDMVQTRLVAGASGLDNQIRWVTIVEVLEDASRLQEGEFLITTGFGLAVDEDRLARFIPSLAERKLSGVALHTGFYLREIPQSLIETANQHGLPLIEIPLEMNFSTITKAILQPIINRQFETLAYSEAIHNQIIEAALSKGGLSAIADELAKLTGGSLKLVDAFGYDVVQCDEYGLTTGIESKPITRSVSIRANRETYGTLSLTKPDELWKELDHVAMQHAATLCALEYMKERAIAATEWRLKGDFVEEILSGRVLPEAEWEARSQMLGYPLLGSHLVVAVKIPRADESELTALHHKCITLLKRLAERHHSAYLLRERAHHLLLVLPASKTSDLLVDNLTVQWNKLFPTHSLQIGKSNPRFGLAELREAAEEAMFALQACPLLAQAPTPVSFAQMQGYQFLFPYHRHPDSLQPLWEPLLHGVIEYDTKHGQQLLETLHAYVNHNQNGLKAAQTLFIHRHTLKYRLQQIEEKTGCQLEDAAQCWQLQLALMAYRLHQLLYPL